MTTLVVDASIAIKWQVQEVLNDEARAVLTRNLDLIAPDFLLLEAANTFWRKVKRSELLEVHARRHLEELPAYFAELVPTASLVERALWWGFMLRHPVYDCLYLALAEQEEAMLITADAKFHAVVSASGRFDRIKILQ